MMIRYRGTISLHDFQKRSKSFGLNSGKIVIPKDVWSTPIPKVDKPPDVTNPYVHLPFKKEIKKLQIPTVSYRREDDFDLEESAPNDNVVDYLKKVSESSKNPLGQEQADFIQRKMRQYKYHIAVSDQNEKIWRDSKSHVRKQEQLIQELGSVEGAIQETLQPTNVSFRKELKSRPLDRKILEEIYKDLHGKRSERALKKNIHWEHWKAKCEENMPLILSSSQRAKETFGFGGKIVKVRSAKSLDQFPVSPLPEVGFFGRTNSGRSSLINAIVNTFICPYGHLKGTTTTANFYNIADKLMIVDLPGYGYYHPMQTNPLQSDNGYKLSRLYLKECGGTFNNARDDKTNESNSGRISTSTRNIKRLFICVPANTGLHDSDLHFCKSCNEMRIPFSIILTKTDTVTITMLARIADHTRSKMLPFSECKELFMANSLRLAGIGKLQTALGNIARREGLGSDSHIDELAFESIV